MSSTTSFPDVVLVGQIFGHGIRVGGDDVTDCSRQRFGIPLFEVQLFARRLHIGLVGTWSFMSGGPARNPQKTRTSFRVFQKPHLLRQLVAFQKPYRRLELPLVENPEADQNASNAGMLQSGMPRPTKCQKFRRISTRCHRVGSRQSESLKRRSPWPCRTSLLRLIFSAVAFVFSSLNSSWASPTYKGVRNPEFQEIGRNKAELLSGDEVAAFRHPSMLGSVSAFGCGIFRVLSAAKLRVDQSEAAKASLECQPACSHEGRRKPESRQSVNAWGPADFGFSNHHVES